VGKAAEDQQAFSREHCPHEAEVTARRPLAERFPGTFEAANAALERHSCIGLMKTCVLIVYSADFLGTAVERGRPGIWPLTRSFCAVSVPVPRNGFGSYATLLILLGLPLGLERAPYSLVLS